MTEAEVDQLRAVAHPLRLRILELLSNTERNVGEIEQLSGIGQPALSQQLGVLRKAELVETRKQAKLVYYRIATEQVQGLAKQLADLAPLSEGADRKVRAASPGAANFAKLAQG